MDGAYITAVRTAAGSALATRLLTRPDADILLIIGTGVQAWAHVQAIPRVRSIKEIRIVARSREKGEQITLYKSVGVAIQDAVAAQLVMEASRTRGVGTELSL